jgi:Predicted signal transduction protein
MRMFSAAPPEAEAGDWRAVLIPSPLLDCLCGRLQRIQMLPSIAQQALQVAKDPDCSIRDFSRLVEQDIKLATEMLRIANSPIYSGGRPVASLSEATLRLGLAHCKNLIITSCISSLISDLSAEETWIRDVLWRHGMATGVIAVNLNRTLGVGFQGEEFTAGLMHDIGRILLAVALPQQFLRGDPVDFLESDDLLERERTFFRTTHAEVGAWFAIGNNLPDCLIAAIRFHHAPLKAPAYQRLTALIAAADDIANFLQRNESAEGYCPLDNPAIDLLEQCGVWGARDRFERQLDVILENALEDALELCGA